MTIHITFDLIGRIVVWAICLTPVFLVLVFFWFMHAIGGFWPWDHWEWVNRLQRRSYERKHGKP